MVNRQRWNINNLDSGPKREQLVAAVNALWVKKKEQYSNLGKLLALARPHMPVIVAGFSIKMVESALSALHINYQNDMIRAIERLNRPDMVRGFRSLIYMQLITLFLANMSDRFTRHGADALSRSLKRVVGKAIISQDLRYFDVVSSPASVLRDAEDINGALVYRPQRVMGRVVNLLSTAAVAHKQSPELLYRMAVVMPVTQIVRAVIVSIFRKRQRRQQRGRMDTESSAEGLVTVCNNSESMRMVRSFGREVRTLGEYDTSNKVQDILSQQTDMLLDMLRPLFSLAQRSSRFPPGACY